jgi:hypothetical protein
MSKHDEQRRRPARVMIESTSAQMQNRKQARDDALELKTEAELTLSNEAYYEKMWKAMK